ncbi:Acyl-CoA synthetase family member 2, mitochondrial [Amphibalanus amphitrite]|uniref:Medium-chain acyl-CoA ligase ACSF2, mitochondrial n=1 Tax=Amphibalanus amphitrite TaxID=1232801 RepID=A0A6A4VJS5_AMPAM|nr:Acyl-CoA synthetase family member 2, mitochondrial [Amphibalanus amphitrite]
MMATGDPLRFCVKLLNRTARQIKRSSSTAAAKRAAPATHLTESYVHCAGTTPLVHDTLGDVIDRAAVDYGTNEALVFVHQDLRRTWREVKQEVRAERLAHGFMALGLEFGDRIGIWGTNVYEWQLTQYAAAKAGLALVNVNQAYQANELEYCLKKVGVKTLVATDGYKTSDYYDMLTRLLPELTSEGESNVPLTLRSERLPHLRSVVMISQQRRRGVLRFDDLLDSGMESLSGELQRRQAQVNCDDHCSIQFTSTFDAEASLKATEDERRVLGLFGIGRCTHLYGTPTMFVDMVNIAKQKRHDLSSVHSGVVAGAPVPFHLMQAMINDLNMRDAVVGYGLTECSPLLTLGFPSDDLEHRCGTVGYPLAHTELKVVDGQGRTAPVGQPGVLCARGYCNFLGYWDDAEKTAETLTPQRWLITG